MSELHLPMSGTEPFKKGFRCHGALTIGKIFEITSEDRMPG